MAAQEKTEFNMDNVELKMPEDNFIETEPETNKTSVMSLVLFGIILLLIGILGTLLWWGSTLLTPELDQTNNTEALRPTPEENNEPESTTAEARVQALQTVSSSDEISAIEADLMSTTVGDIESELRAIDTLLQEAPQKQ